MLTPYEAQRLTEILIEHGQITDEERGDLVAALTRATAFAPTPPAEPSADATDRPTRRRTRDFDATTQPIPRETIDALRTTARRTRDL